MSAEQALFDAYSKWRRLVIAENKAIDKQDWGFLLECQKITHDIQPSITKLTREARNEWKQKANSAAREKRLGTVVSELAKLLEGNQKLLCAARATALCQRDRLEQAGRNLKRLQNSYATARPSAWTSFS